MFNKLLLLFSILFLFTILIPIINGANILILLSLPSPSQHLWHSKLVNALATSTKQHNVTFISSDLDKSTNKKNMHHIQTEGVYEFLYGSVPFDLTSMGDTSTIDSICNYHEFCHITCEVILKSKGMQMILNYPKDFKFDLIIYDHVCGPCLLGLLHRFNYPTLITATAFNIPPYTMDFMGGHHHYSYIPHYALAYDTTMNFWERCYNALITMFDSFYRTYVFIPKLNKIVRELIVDCPDLGMLEKKSVLALVNSHPANDFPQPLPPNIIPVGGLQIQPAKPLTKDLEDFIDKSKKGAVLFSLGTNIRSDTLGADKQMMLINAFSQMPEYNFLWKFESDTLPMKLPENVLVRPWMPQNDILAHPKIKAFITHAGLLSSHEATWHGVPMIGIPIFLDQQRNLLKSILAGVAEKLPLQTMTTPLIKDTILRVLENPSYQIKMKIRSARFRDQPETPLDRALWWIEWVLRNPQPDHIQSPVIKLGFFRANHYDIILFLVVILLLLYYLICSILKCFIRKFSAPTVDKKKKLK